jgi:tetratricopeptide (TPR) repeat protein
MTKIGQGPKLNANPMLSPALLVILAAAPAAVAGLPPLTPLERSLAAHARDGKLVGTTLLDAALLASGVPEQDIPAAAKRVRAAIAPAIARAAAQQGEAARGRALLAALHETVLRRYDLAATELDQVERTGEFNCLSSALLYLVAAEGVVPSARGAVTPSHAFVRVTVDGKTVDVETTTPAGFDPDRSKVTPAQVRQLAGGDVSPEAFREGLKQAEELPSLSLVAAVYSNRAVILARQGDVAAAALALDRGARMATGGLQRRLADWRASIMSKGAKELMELGRYDDARLLLELSLEVTEGTHRALLTENLAIAHYQLGVAATERKDWAAALAHAETAAALGFKNEALQTVKANALAQLAAVEGSAVRCGAEGLAPGSAGAAAATECLVALAREVLERDAPASLQYSRRALQLAADDVYAKSAIVLALDRQARAESEASRCEEVEALVAEGLPHAPALAPQKWEGRKLAGVCWEVRSRAAFAARDWNTASAELLRAKVFMPDDKSVAQNLARVELNRGVEFANQGACDDARPHLVAALQGDRGLDEKVTKTLATCAGKRAKKAAEAGDWALVLAETRRGLRDAPNDEILKQNLVSALHNYTLTLLKAGRCDEARALKAELGPGDESLQESMQRACP